MNYWREIVLSVSIIEIVKPWLLECSNFEWAIPTNNECLLIYSLRYKNKLCSRNPIERVSLVYGT